MADLSDFELMQAAAKIENLPQWQPKPYKLKIGEALGGSKPAVPKTPNQLIPAGIHDQSGNLQNAGQMTDLETLLYLRALDAFERAVR